MGKRSGDKEALKGNGEALERDGKLEMLMRRRLGWWKGVVRKWEGTNGRWEYILKGNEEALKGDRDRVYYKVADGH